MKVSPGMAEAGVNAMARLKRGATGDTALVAGVYNAMELCRVQEEKARSGLPQKPYSHQEWPSWRYGPDGIGRAFERPEDVPEGWTEAPPSLLPAETVIPLQVAPERQKRKYTKRIHAPASGA